MQSKSNIDWADLLRQAKQASAATQVSHLATILFLFDSRLPDARTAIATAIDQVYPRKSKEKILCRALFESFYFSQQGQLASANRTWDRIKALLRSSRLSRFARSMCIELALIVAEMDCDLHDFGGAHDALVWIEESKKLHPRHRAALNFVRAVFSYRKREAAATEKYIDRAWREFAPYPAGTHEAAIFQLRINALKGQLLALEGQNDAALDTLVRAIEFTEDAPRPDREKADILLKRSRIVTKLGDFERSIRIARTALAYAERPDIANDYLQALAHQRLGEAKLNLLRNWIRKDSSTKPQLAPELEGFREETKKHFRCNLRLSQKHRLQNTFARMLAYLGLAMLESLTDTPGPGTENATVDLHMKSARELAEQLPAGHPERVIVDICAARISMKHSDFDTALRRYDYAVSRLDSSGMKFRAAEVRAESAQLLLDYNTDEIHRSIRLAADAMRLAQSEPATPISPKLAERLEAIPLEEWLLHVAQFGKEEFQHQITRDEIVQGLSHAIKHILRELNDQPIGVSVQQEIERMQHLIELLLLPQRPDLDSNFDLFAVVDKANRDCANAFRRANCELALLTNELESPVFVSGSSLYLELALENLIRNALVHGHGVHSIHVAMTDVHGELHAQIAIFDNGDGLVQPIAHWLVEPTSSTPTGRNSVGTGLKFVKSVIHKVHMGRIRVNAKTQSNPHAITILIPVLNPLPARQAT